MSESEVARLRRQIEMELVAAQQGMYGLTTGSARHEFIRKRMDRVGTFQDELALKVGEEAANQMVYSIYTEAIG